MNELFLGFLIISISFIGLAIGLIFRSQPLKGSCGGMANLEEAQNVRSAEGLIQIHAIIKTDS